MADISPNLALPFLQAAQAQKHVTHNEALRRLDVLVRTVVTDHTLTLPPALPQDGACYIPGSGSLNAWAGKDDQIAAFLDGAWQFFSPQTGWSVYALSLGATLTYDGTGWLAAADLPLRVAQLGVSTDADQTNRLAVSSDATLLSHSGAGHQVKVNKAAPADTASLLFQSGWSGRAEMGLAGDDAWSLKVSPDGAAWYQAMQIDPASAEITLSPAGTGRVRFTDTAAVFDTPVTGTGVQASETDAAAGKLLKTGAFGLGGAVALSGAANLKDRGLRPGFYSYQASEVTGGPESTAALHTLIVTQVNGDDRHSFLSLRTAGTGGRIWLGSQDSGNGAITWQRVLSNDLIVGTVGQALGVPSGAVIERGANANGDYVRFADGTQICWLRDRNFGSILATGSGTWYEPYRTTPVSVTWPAVFAVPPSVSSNATLSEIAVSPAARMLLLHPSSVPTTTGWTSLMVSRVAGTAMAGNAIVTITAIGRWF